MPQPNDLEVFLVLEGDEILLESSLTVGRHLDNDLIVAGEDVLDYHVRVEMTPRGPRVFPLGEATLTVNEQLYGEPRGLIPDDRLRVGQSEVTLAVRPIGPPLASEWWLHGTYGRQPIQLADALTIGRGDDCDVLLMDDHISREHARLVVAGNVVWIEDLDSANGTYVNAERVIGGCRLFHGDFIKLDVVEFQLVGRGKDLTPTRSVWDTTQHARIKNAPETDNDTTEVVAVADPQPQLEAVATPEGEGGAFLIGAGDPVSGKTFRIALGRTVIGRAEDCDIVVKDRTVSLRHVELILRPEGCTLTNLMATNGSRINGIEVQSAELNDGDVLRLGGVPLVYKEVATLGSRRFIRRTQTWLLAASLVIVAVLAWTLLSR